MTDRFFLELPARAELVSTVRLFSAALGRHFGLGEEAVADLKLGVSEACAGLIRSGPGEDARLELVVTRRRGGLDFEVGPSGERAGLEGDSGIELLVGLFPDAELGPDGRVAFSVPFEISPGG